MDKNNKDVENYTKKGKAVFRAGPKGSEKNAFKGMPAWMMDGKTAVSQAEKDRYAVRDAYKPKDDAYVTKKMQSDRAYQNSYIARAAKESALARRKSAIGSKLKKG
jgi:hypothetical protein